VRIVIIGNGVAGIEAALTVRAREPEWPITIVSEESDHFFSRTALMYVLCGQLSHACIEPHERDLYERMRFTRVRARAIGVDPSAKQVKLSGRDALPYDRLLIACGSAPRAAPWPGADLRGVGHFVTMQDLEWLERAIHGGPGKNGRPPNADAHLVHSRDDSPYRARPVAERTCARPIVIGGGLIGIEVIEVMLAAKLRPRFLIREDHFWPIALDRDEATWIADALRAHGVDVHVGENVEALEGDGSIAAVRTHRDRYECDLCVVSIGVVPNTWWLGQAVELRDGAIAVDGGLATSAPDVFAAGDCASVRWYDGKYRPEQLWYTARDQGRVVGRRILGDSVTYRRGTFYNSAKLMDIEYTTAGVLEGESWSFEERGPVKSRTRIAHVEGRVIGFNMLGRRWDHSVLIEWIEQRRSLEWVKRHLNEARFDTELVPPMSVSGVD
jgi:NADPH-dependent 2,4-dienoyl-CoA reductase/sulfur reductase-like enzyme